MPLLIYYHLIKGLHTREELVERALRFIAVQQTAKKRITMDANTGREAITVFCTLSIESQTP